MDTYLVDPTPNSCATTPAPVSVQSCCTVHDGALAALTTMLYGVLCAAQSKLGDPRNYPVDINPCSKYDYIIVGGGSAGSIVASRLTENSNNTVLLMEAGVDPSESSEVPNLQKSVSLSCDAKIYKMEPNSQSCLGSKDGRCILMRGTTLGGTSVISQNLFIHGNREDYNYWAQVTNDPKWNYDNMLPVIKKTENYRIANDYHGQGGYINVAPYNHDNDDMAKKIEEGFNCVNIQTKDLNAGDQIGFMIADIMQRDGKKENIAKIYLKPARARTNLYVSKSTLVTKLLYDKVCRRIVGAEYYKNGVSKLVYATKEVIVTADAIRTAQLLMVSGIGPQEELKQLGIEVIKDVPDVGKNLQFHTQTLALCFALKKLPPPTSKNPKLAATFNYLVEGNGILSSYSYEDLIAFINTEIPTSKYPNIQINPHFAPVKSMILASVLDAYGLTEENKQVYLKLNEDNALLFFGIELLRSNCMGNIKIRSSNVRDDPLIYPNVFCNNADVNNVLDAVKFCLKLSLTKPMKKLGASLVGRVPACAGYSNCDDYWRCAVRQITRVYHPVGTCSMGKVVDGDLKITDVNGLRVGGGGVIPRAPAGHLLVPLVANSEVLAQIADPESGSSVPGSAGKVNLINAMETKRSFGYSRY